MDMRQHIEAAYPATAPQPPVDLRPYQRSAIDTLMHWFTLHEGNPAIVIPTAGGKTIVFGTLIKECLQTWPDVRILVLAHQKELIKQAEAKLKKVWPDAPVGVYAASLKRREIAQITIASRDSVHNRASILGFFDLVIIDECHRINTSDEGRYRKLISDLKQTNPHMRVIGFTATPYRMSSGMITDGDNPLITDIAYEASIKDLIKDGYLCPLVSKSGKPEAIADVSEVHIKGGEFVQKELEEVVNKNDLVEAALDEVMRDCANRHSWVIFCASVKHADHVSESLSHRGIHAPVIHGDMDADLRDELLAAFDRGEIRALCNVNILTEGWDAPRLDAVIMLRPTQSPGLYVQMVGRGFRLHESKQNTLVLDLAGNIQRHGPVDTVRPRPKGAKKGNGVAPVKECPKCQELVHASAKVCPGFLESGEPCGHDFPQKAPHSAIADLAPILSTETKILEITVSDVFYAKHEKAGRPPTMKVSYWDGGINMYHEWISLEHEGYARAKAERWWKQRADVLCPSSVDAALDWIQWTEKPGALFKMRKPLRIRVELGGKYPKIKGYQFDGRSKVNDL